MAARGTITVVNENHPRESVSAMAIMTRTEEVDHRIHDVAALDHEDHFEALNDASFKITTNGIIVCHPQNQSRDDDCFTRSNSSITDGSEVSLIQHLTDEDCCLNSIFEDDDMSALGDVENENTPKIADGNVDLLSSSNACKATAKSEESHARYYNSEIPTLSKSISYAQLFFDPETNLLVTLMEVNLPSARTIRRFSIFDDDDWHHQCDPRGKAFLQSAAASKPTNNEVILARLHDKTMMTACSSISPRSPQNSVNCGENLTLNKTLRYPYEPIIFSHGRQLWMEEPDLGLYLLHDNDGPCCARVRKGRCTETLKELLTASRLRICRRQLCESNWRAGRDVSKNAKLVHIDSLPYSVLQNV